jgi:hypothetical protein
MQDLQLGDARPTLKLLKPGFAFQQTWLVKASRRHPAVAFAQQTDEVRPASIDFAQAQGKGQSLLGLLLRHTPAEIDVNQLDATVTRPSVQSWKYPLHQPLTLLHEVHEGRRQKHPDLAGFGGSGVALDHADAGSSTGLTIELNARPAEVRARWHGYRGLDLRHSHD